MTGRTIVLLFITLRNTKGKWKMNVQSDAEHTRAVGMAILSISLAPHLPFLASSGHNGATVKLEMERLDRNIESYCCLRDVSYSDP